ncbi:MAG: TIGR03085 family metal-binding protein [Sciscionella sp.]
MGVATAERRATTATMAEVGADAPTLCAGWVVRDLAAHLLIRDRRPDAAPGIVLRALAGHTRTVQQRFAARPFAELLELLRSPPWYSPFALPVLGELINAGEYLVHHEDVRRAQPGWQPRVADTGRSAAAWRTLSAMGRLAYRGSPVGVRLDGGDGRLLVASKRPSPVTLRADPLELLLHAFGRDEVRIDFDGEPDAVATLTTLSRGL